MYVCLTYMHTHLDQSVDQMVSLGGMVMKKLIQSWKLYDWRKFNKFCRPWKW
jgi:hypothetical protein